VRRREDQLNVRKRVKINWELPNPDRVWKKEEGAERRKPGKVVEMYRDNKGGQRPVVRRRSLKITNLPKKDVKPQDRGGSGPQNKKVKKSGKKPI